MPISRGADRATTPLLAPLRRHDPAQVGPYLLLGRLGAGAMGRVYLGRSPAGRLVAVKTIRDDYAEEPDFRDRFAHEVAAARRVSGVFTAAVVAADPEAEVPWLATAYVPAPSLSRLVETCGPLPVPAVRWLAAGCAEALESIHAAGLVHRDLKPSNVLVSLDGPQVIDFGVARAVERIQLTATREALGTPAYMAPEQAREARSTGPASDVFSLGSTLLYAATGHAPYQGETTVDVLVRLATEPPDLAGLPAELADPLQRCLDRDPDRRPTPAQLVAGIAATMRFEGNDGSRSLPPRAVAL
ncbi:MAG TPA: serine/threonine-protein kinase, partial [Mycobacteriales bacterium]|nr:serine/threonine-protein kinase [Mycobacteriales bacterium]